VDVFGPRHLGHSRVIIKEIPTDLVSAAATVVSVSVSAATAYATLMSRHRLRHPRITIVVIKNTSLLAPPPLQRTGETKTNVDRDRRIGAPPAYARAVVTRAPLPHDWAEQTRRGSDRVATGEGITG